MIHRVLALAGCGAAALIVFAAVVSAAGASPVSVLLMLATGGAVSWYGIVEAVVKAIPILFCAMAAAVPGRQGLVNIGVEGQLLLGAIGSTLAVRWFPGLPGATTLLLMASAAGLAGAAWGVLPGVLRGVTRSNETVIGLLLNYVPPVKLEV